MDEEIIARFQKDVMPHLKEILADCSDLLAQRPIDIFQKALKKLVIAGFTHFYDIAGVASVEELTARPRLRALFVITLISDLNSVLPLDYPYIIGIVHVADENNMYFQAFPRQKIPGTHELLNRGIVLIAKANTKAEAFSPDIQYSAKYISNDDFIDGEQNPE